MKRSWLAMGAGVMLISLFTGMLGCAAEKPAGEISGPIALASDPVGGAVNTFETGWAKIITKYTALVPTVTATSGGREQTRLLAEAKTDVAVASNVNVGEVLVLGKEDFLTREQVMSIRLLFNTGPYFEKIITLEESGIKTIRDLKGKRISMGPAGSNAEKWGKIIFAAHGLTDYDTTNLSYAESAEALKNKEVHAVVILQKSPLPLIEELSLRHKFRFIPVDPATYGEITSKAGGSYPAKMGTNIYKNQTNEEPVDAVGLAVPLGSPATFSEDKIYTIVKVLFEHMDEFAETSAIALSFAEHHREYMLDGMLLPLHKGALRYYREAGIDVPEKLIPPEAK